MLLRFFNLSDILVLVIRMELFQNIIVTDIKKPFVVNSAAGRNGIITDRTSFGLSFCQSGQITYTMDGNRYVSKPGTVVLLPKGGSYTLHGDKDGLFPVINFQCKNLNCTKIALIPLADQDTCIRLFEEMKGLSLSPENRLEILSVFYKLLSNLSSRCAPKPLYFLNKYLEKNLADPTLSNTRLAAEMGISEVYLRKLFTTYYKTTPKQYILDLRLRKAKQLLVDTTLAVTDISSECGFSSLYHFCRCFKNKTGMTPTEYAKQNRIFQI